MELNNSEILKVLSGAIEEATEKASRSVVSVGAGHRSGTGVVLGEELNVLTAGHVVHGRSEVMVGLKDGSEVKAEVLGRNPYSDLALLRVPNIGMEPLELGDSEHLKTGQFVLAIAGQAPGRTSATSGIVTGTRRSIGGWWNFSVKDAIVTDARLNPGYSGGPLLNADGKMVGMNVAYFSNRGIAVPAESIRKDLPRLAKGSDVKRAYLGIVSSPIELPQYVSAESGVDQDEGLMIYSVEPGSAARKAGVALGDVLISFAGTPIRGLQDLEPLLTEDAVGKEAKILVLRGEKQKELVVVPEGRDDSR
jgi:serine protease DegQ